MSKTYNKYFVEVEFELITELDEEFKVQRNIRDAIEERLGVVDCKVFTDLIQEDWQP